MFVIGLSTVGVSCRGILEPGFGMPSEARFCEISHVYHAEILYYWNSPGLSVHTFSLPAQIILLSALR